MAKFLIDANLLYYFGLWNNSDFIHVKDLNDSWSDEIIWKYSLENNLTIITKDADFSLKVLYRGAPPKVIHLKFGNLRIGELHKLISKIWTDIELLLNDNSLINVYLDRIESIKLLAAPNLMALFRQFILNSKTQHTLSTLRYKTFAIGTYFEKIKDKYILKIALNQKRREWFTWLWKNTNEINLPFIFSNA